MALAFRNLSLITAAHKVLHFAPEKIVTDLIKKTGAEYLSADIEPGRADIVLNIEAIDFPDQVFDVVVASHILEHVDDRKALKEVRRILKPGGKLIAAVPIVEGWDTTYENASVTSESERWLHFGKDDHVRYYGRDFRDRVRAARFDIEEFVSTGEETVRFGLTRGDRLFICKTADEP